MNSFLKYWIPVILWAGVIFTLSAIPHLKSELPSSWDLLFRKIAHMAEYGLLAMLLLRAFAQEDKPRFWDMIAVFKIAVLYSISDEIHQASVLGRHGSIWDVGIDIIGIALGIILYAVVKRGVHVKTKTEV